MEPWRALHGQHAPSRSLRTAYTDGPYPFPQVPLDYSKPEGPTISLFVRELVSPHNKSQRNMPYLLYLQGVHAVGRCILAQDRSRAIPYYCIWCGALECLMKFLWRKGPTFGLSHAPPNVGRHALHLGVAWPTALHEPKAAAPTDNATILCIYTTATLPCTECHAHM